VRKTTPDVRNLPASVEDALNRTSTLQYDSKRRLTRSANPLGQALVMVYDDLDRLIQVTDAMNVVTKQTFDADGNRTSLANGRDAVTIFTYDAGSRLLTTTTAGGRATTMTYNSRSLVATLTEPSGQATAFTYDDAGRITRSSDPTGQIDFTYDDAGRPLTVTSGASTLSRQYDALGRVTQFTDAAGNVLKYAYDAAGNLVKLTYPDGKEVDYTYDIAGRLIRVTDWAARTTTYAYDADGRLTTTTRPNGTVETRVWNEAGELAQMTDMKGTTRISQYGFVRDPAGRILRENPLPAPVLYSPVSFTASYDADNRLTAFNGSATTFDADGNMTSGPSVTGTGNEAYVYDSRNRLTSFGGTTYGYDAENRRISITDASGTTHFVVNSTARLSQVLVRTAPDGTVTRAVYGLGLIYEETGASVRYYHSDYRGSSIAFTNAAGAVTGRVDYGPFGEIAARTGDTATPYLFNGRYGVMTDSNGLYHMRARYYHPVIRRFVNQDVILGAISSNSSMNRFAYANGNPVSLMDPLGTEATEAESTMQSFLDFLDGIGDFKMAYDVFKYGSEFFKYVGNLELYLTMKRGGLTWLPVAQFFLQNHKLNTFLLKFSTRLDDAFKWSKINGPFALIDAVQKGGTFLRDPTGSNYLSYFTAAPHIGAGAVISTIIIRGGDLIARDLVGSQRVDNFWLSVGDSKGWQWLDRNILSARF
jgi:RHS repeat-associated protein